MEYHFTFVEIPGAYHFGTKSCGMGIFYDDNKDFGAGYYGNAVVPGDDIPIVSVGPFDSLEKARAEVIKEWERLMKLHGSERGIEFSEYLSLGLELDGLLEQFPKMQVFGALKVAVKNMKAGKSGRWMILTDMDKYRDGFMEYEEPCNKLREMLIRHKIIDSSGRMIR
jgi:hypothetical protein